MESHANIIVPGTRPLKIGNPSIAARAPRTSENIAALLHGDGYGLAGVAGGAKGQNYRLRTGG